MKIIINYQNLSIFVWASLGAGEPAPGPAAGPDREKIIKKLVFSAGPAGQLEELTSHQRAMPPLGALGESRNHRDSGRHVDARRQGLRGKNHLH